MLIAGAAAFSPVPVAEHATFSGQPSSSTPATAAKETSDGPVLNACPIPGSHSRADQSSQYGITSQRVIPVILKSHGFAAADFFANSAHEPGFDQLLRAPPFNS